MGDTSCGAEYPHVFSTTCTPTWRCARPRGHDGWHEAPTGADSSVAWHPSARTEFPPTFSARAVPPPAPPEDRAMGETREQQQGEGWTKKGQPQEPEPSRDADVRPFSCGTEGYDWTAANCDRCARNGPYDAHGDGPCPMETAVSRGFILGTVPAALAVEYGATLSSPGHCRMPRQCSRFAPLPECEWVSWPGTRRRVRCNEPMVATVEANGYTRAVCARHLQRFAAEHPERAPVPAVDPSRSTPDTHPDPTPIAGTPPGGRTP